MSAKRSNFTRLLAMLILVQKENEQDQARISRHIFQIFSDTSGNNTVLL